MNYLFIFVGGGLGSVVRYFLSAKVHGWGLAGDFPLGILTINIFGCLMAGLLFGVSSKLTGDFWLPLLMIGFLGGFTTMSAFSVESLLLIQAHKYLYAGIYIGATLTLSLMAAMGGFLAGQVIIGNQ